MSTDAMNKVSNESALHLVDAPPGVKLMSPTNGATLEVSSIQGPGTGILYDGDEFWPVVEGIPYLRADKESLRREVIQYLRVGSCREALNCLLRDQDDFAPDPPPTSERLNQIIDGVMSKGLSLRTAMEMLEYGPVAHYFAHRWSTPTFLSGLGLLAQHWIGPDVVIEIACGIGQFLRKLQRNNIPNVGVDVVYSKLWLAKQFVCPNATLVCADVTRRMVPLEVGASITSTVFCHDAFYFFPNKQHVAAEFSRLTHDAGNILVGHAHNVEIDHGVAGAPLTPEGYAELFPSALLFDDNDYVDVYMGEKVALPKTSEELRKSEAISLVTTGTTRPRENWNLTRPPLNTPLRLNPLLQVNESGKLVPTWPMTQFAREYANATYLHGEKMPTNSILRAISVPEIRPEDVQEVRRLASRRILLSLPERW